MNTRITTILAIATGVLLIAFGARAWAGSDSQCGMNMSSQPTAATDEHQAMSASAEIHEGHQMGMTGMSRHHGGQGHLVGPFDFESVFTESDVRLYVTRTDGAPVDLTKLSGTATITGPDKKASTVELTSDNIADDPMATHRHMAGMTEDVSAYLSAPYQFGVLPDDAATVEFSLTGLADTDNGTADWKQAFTMTPLFGNACPMHSDQAALADGTCSVCGGMALQPARVLYGCCPACPEMRSTSPTTCEKCGMEMQLKSVGTIDSNPSPEHHQMNMGHMKDAG